MAASYSHGHSSRSTVDDHTVDLGGPHDAEWARRRAVLVNYAYKLLGPLGSGGFGDTYLGEHRETGQIVAVKLIRSGLEYDPDRCAGALRERITLAALDSPYIPAFLTGGVCDFHRDFLVMKYVPGQTLAEWLKANEGARLMPLAKAVEVFLCIARALRHMQLRGWLHGDVKCGNIILNEGGAAATLIDVGAAAELRGSPPRATARSFVGTPKFAAPAALRGQPMAPADDLYSLGVVMFQVLVGEHPFTGTSGEADPAFRAPPLVSSFPRYEDPIGVPLVPVPVPPALCALVARLLDDTGTERRLSAAAVVRALCRIRARLRGA